MVITDVADMVVESKGHIAFDRVVLPVLAVPSQALPGEKGRFGDPLPVEFPDHALDPFRVVVGCFLVFQMVKKLKGHPFVDDGLLLQGVLEIIGRDGDIGKDLVVGLPSLDSPRRRGLDRGLGQTPYVVTLFKMKFIKVAVAGDLDIKPLGSVLGGTGPQTVETQAVLVVLAQIGLVFAPRIKLTVNQFPIEALFQGIKIQRDPPPPVDHLDGMVGETGHADNMAVSFPGFVDGVG